MRMLVAGTALAALTVASVALASSGGLTPKGCIADTSFNPGCSQQSRGLEDAKSIAITPDGRSIYVASFGDNSLVRFARSTTTGAVTPKGCFGDQSSNPGGCGQTAKGLTGAISTAVSPDGKSVYVASFSDNAVAIFDRSPAGALTYRGCIGDVDSNPANCAKTTKGLNEARAVTVSPNGKSVYVGSFNDDAIARFNRSPTGALSPRGCVGDVNNNPDHCGQEARGLEGVAGLAVSADGRSLYAVSYNGSAFAPFNRDRTTGALTPRQCWGERGNNFEHCSRSAKGLLSPTAVISSSDGKSVYVAGSQDNALARFDRNTKTLVLTAHGCIGDAASNSAGCPHTARGLNNSFGLALSADGGSLYVASEGDNALARFDRSPGGALTSRNCVGDRGSNDAHCAQTTRGLRSTFGVVVAPKGRSVYAISDSDSALVRFDRQP